MQTEGEEEESEEDSEGGAVLQLSKSFWSKSFGSERRLACTSFML